MKRIASSTTAGIAGTTATQRLSVVASRTGGLPEVVRDGETGFLVTPGDVSELHDRIDQLLRDAALAQRMGEAARALVVHWFTWEATAQRCLAAYAELDCRESPPR